MAAESDMQTHRAMYQRLIGLMKYGAVICLVIAFVVIWLISHK